MCHVWSRVFLGNLRPKMVLAEAGQRQNIFIESFRLEKTSRIIVSDFDQSPPCLTDHGTSFLEHLQGWWLSLGEPEEFAHRNRVFRYS